MMCIINLNTFKLTPIHNGQKFLSADMSDIGGPIFRSYICGPTNHYQPVSVKLPSDDHQLVFIAHRHT